MLVFSIVCFELDCLQSLSRAGLTALTSSCRGWWDHFDVANTGISFTPLGSGKALVAFSDSSRCMPGPGVWYMNSCSIQKRTGESQFFFCKNFISFVLPANQRAGDTRARCSLHVHDPCVCLYCKLLVLWVCCSAAEPRQSTKTTSLAQVTTFFHL